VLCHATGFHARCWNQIVARLPGRHVIALDFRGHGQSSKPDPPYAWRPFGEDLAGLLGQLGLRGAKGVGHSMGGHAVALAASLHPEAFSSLLLLDPVILPPAAYTAPQAPIDFVLRRRNQWANSDEMFQRFRDRPPFQSWDPRVLRDYCDYGLLGSALACPPAVEASIYAHSMAAESNIHAEAAALDIPVRVVRSGTPYTYGLFSGSPTDPGLASRLRHGVDDLRTNLSHFIPMEAPDLVAELILGL